METDQRTRTVRLVYGVCLAATLACNASGLVESRRVQVSGLLLGVALLGLPHGAFDLGLLESRAKSSATFLLAIVVYLATVVTAASLMLIAPQVFFPPFILLGVSHFGFEELEAVGYRRPPLLLSAVVGCLVFLAPLIATQNGSHLFAGDSPMGQSFSSMVSLSSSLSSYLALLLAAGLVAILLSLTWVQLRRLAVNTVLIVPGLTLLPTLVAFTLYFCCWHSLRHSLCLIDSLREEMSSGCRWRQFLLASVAWLGALALFLQVTGMMNFPQLNDPKMVQILFAFLLGLATPHFLLQLNPRKGSH